MDIPSPTPPVTATSPAVTDVQANLKRQQLRRKSISATMKAGASNPYQPAQSGSGNLAAAPSVSNGGTKTG